MTPAEIGQLLALTWLNLENNQLKALPAEIEQLSVLNHLFLKKNQLKSLPHNLREDTLYVLNDGGEFCN